MKHNNKLIQLSKKLSDPKSLVKFLQQPTIAITETLTGILSSDTSELKLATGRIVQGALKFKLLTQLGKELKILKDKGKIKEDYFATHQQQATLVDLLKFIDEECPDEEVFKALKSIFFTSISKNSSEQNSLKAYHFLQICKQLKSGDILLLKTCYKIFKKREKEPLTTTSASGWISETANQSKLLQGMVELYEDNLMQLKLISGRVHSDRTGVEPGKFRLTDLGIELCEFITKYP